ncbi:methyltransferase domain-containing protein [Rutstroemia sp. NJR-2017a BBW]|nr:methyltransferase domain-containing protein [Rutstroemia sp. NJR-2017a BBW]
MDADSRRQTTTSQRLKGYLWTPNQDAPLTRPSFDPSNIASIQANKTRVQAMKPDTRRSLKSSPQLVPQLAPHSSQPNHHNSQSAMSPTAGEEYTIILQLETRPISQEQLVAEVKGIYAGLVMVEAKCIEVDNKQAGLTQGDSSSQSKLNNEQWQALIALHRTLLHEHHDFFLASQHPSASLALRRLASKYAMPARMWRHGIHSFLELLRHRLPQSLDHMLAFIYLAYSMMALLYETVPAFEDTWIECLGDLGRYRMAIEDDDIRDREVWTGVARHWYSKASNKAPTTGRLYHHLAILARPNALQQLYYYAKSLCVVVPFTSARESILTLFDPVLNAENGQGQYRLPPLDTAFGTQDQSSPAMVSVRHAERLSNSALEIALLRIGDPNCLSFVHCSLVFMYHMSHFSGAMDILAPAYPWQSLAIYLNTFLTTYTTLERIQDDEFPSPEKNDVRPFPEDYAMQGLLYTEKLYPEKWFLGEKTDEGEKYHELPSMVEQRRERILWLACRIANAGPWIRFDSSNPKFSVDGKATDMETLKSRSTTFASATFDTTLPRAETWSTIGTNSNTENDMSLEITTSANSRTPL